MTEATTEHGLKTKIGIIEKKKDELETIVGELTEPKDPLKESAKESYRMIVSLVLGMLIAYLYSRYPILGELQPDQTAIIIVLTGVVIRATDKAIYHIQRNKHKVAKGVGLDFPVYALSKVFDSKK